MNPLGAVVAAKVIEYVITEKRLIEKVEKWRIFHCKAKQDEKTQPLIKEIRGRGLMIAIELTSKSQEVYEKLLAAGLCLHKAKYRKFFV